MPELAGTNGAYDARWRGPGRGDCPVRCVGFRSEVEVLSGNALGQLQVWDVREPAAAARRSMRSDEKSTEIHSLAVHPMQADMVVAGDCDGSVAVWDLRRPSFPVSITEAHTAEVWRVGFHPRSPDLLYTAGEDGRVIQWNTNPARRADKQRFSIDADTLSTVQLSDDYTYGVNALDVEFELVAFGTDSEELVIAAPSI